MTSICFLPPAHAEQAATESFITHNCRADHFLSFSIMIWGFENENRKAWGSLSESSCLTQRKKQEVVVIAQAKGSKEMR